MFRNLLSFWKGKDFIAKVFEEFKGMLDDSEFMFQAVCKTGKQEAAQSDAGQEGRENNPKSVSMTSNNIRKNPRPMNFKREGNKTRDKIGYQS